MNPGEFRRIRQDVIGVTQEALAARLGTTRVSVARYEAGMRRIPGVVQVALTRLAANPSLRLAGVVAAGKPIEPIEQADLVDVPPSMAGQGDHFALRIKGESMREDGILSGDVVIVRRQASARDGQTVVALLNQEATIKKFYRTPAGVQLRAANAEVEPITVGPTDDLRIQGIVIGLIRHL